MCFDRAATVGSIPLGVTKTFVFKPISGRYVNILVPGRNEFLTLCEVKVFAGKGQREKNTLGQNLFMYLLMCL